MSTGLVGSMTDLSSVESSRTMKLKQIQRISQLCGRSHVTRIQCGLVTISTAVGTS